MNDETTSGSGCWAAATSAPPLVDLVDARRDDIEARTGLRLEVARVAVRSLSRERPVELAEGVLTRDAAAVVDDPDVDVVVEVIGGIEPARELILDALKSGKPVVTANKELLANHGAELFAAADAAGVDLLFEAAVAGGIPIIRPLRESLAGERHQPGDGHRQRHDQLHPHPHERGGELATPRRWPRRRGSATPSATRPPTSRATTPAPRRRSSPPSRSAPGSWPATSTTRASPASPQPTSPSPPASATSSSSWRSPSARGRRRAEIGVRVHPAMVPSGAPAGLRARQLQRRVHRGRRPWATSCSTGGVRAATRPPAPCSAT